MLKQRIVTAVILAVLFVTAMTLISAPVFSTLVMLAIMVAGWEWSGLTKINSGRARAVFMLTLLAVLLVANHQLDVYGDFDQQLSYQICLFALVLWAICFLWIQGYPSSTILWGRSLVIAGIGLVFLLATWIALTAIILFDNGKWLLLLAIIVVVLADVGGFFAGKLFGRHKLAPIISPGKTWEGFVGGLVLQLALILGLTLYLPEVAIIDIAVLVIPVALLSVVGDLFESMLKRHSGVKDSGSLLPGHGGVLDRLDGVMAALPMFWVLLFQGSVF